MRYLFFVLILMGWGACADVPADQNTSNDKAPEGAGTPSASPQGSAANANTLLRHSERAANTGSAVEGNLCKVSFDDSTPLFPVPDNPDGRAFDMNSAGGVYVVIVEAGNTRSTFMLEPKGEFVSLLSSYQAPECLSRKGNFFMGESGAGFYYDGSKYIKYHFDIAKTDTGFRGSLTWDHGKEYGIRVRHKQNMVEY